MATDFQPAPTWADPMLEQTDPKTGEKKTIFNPVWLKWFVDLTANVPAGGAGGGSGSVIGPVLAVSGNVALFNGATGQLIKDGGTLGTSAFTATATPTTLGLVIGTNVQAYNANLTGINQALTTTSSPSFTTVTAALTGHASLDLPLTGGALSGNVTSTGNPSLNLGSGTLTAGAGNFTTGTFATGASANTNIDQNVIAETATNAGQELSVNYWGYNKGTTQYRNMTIYDGKHNAVLSVIGSATPGITVGGTLKTADPGLGVGAWKLGQVESGIGLTLNTTSYIQVMVDGAAVKLAQVL